MPRLTALLSACLAVSCAWAAPVPDAPLPSPPRPPLSEPQRAEAQVQVMAGEMAAGRGQPAQAASAFLAALELIDDVDLAQRATALALSADDRPLALRAARRWQTLAPQEMDPREVIARIALESGDRRETLTQLRAIVQGHAGGEDEGLHHAARLLAQAAPAAAGDALLTAETLAAAYPQRSAGQRALAIVALRFGRLEHAEGAARRALELAPDDKEPAVLLAGVLARRGQVTEAETLFERVAAQDPSPADLRLNFSRVLLDAGQRAAASVQLLKALEAQPDFADAQYALGVLALNARDYDAAESWLRKSLGSGRPQESAFQLGRLAEKRGDHDKALDWYQRVTHGGQAIDALVRRCHVLGKLGRVDDARTLLQNLRQQLPQMSTRFYVVEATLLSDLKQPEAALEVYNAALREFPDDSDLLYSRSLLHETQKRIDLAEADLRTMLRRDPDDARAMNALGYMLTVHTRRYKEAHELIERALKLTPEDAAVIDSLGWVRFKLGDVAGARELLQQALSREPDPEIAAHLGEVLWTLGEKDRARAVWNEALERDPEHRALNETIQRLAPAQE